MTASGTIRVAILGTVLVAAAACSGKKGPTGPEGPAGSLNVIYSGWFTPSSWDTATVFGIRNFNHQQAAPQITQEVLDNGVVLTYGKLAAYSPTIWPTTQVGLLPVTLEYQQGGVQIDTWSAFATPGNLRINFVNSGNIYFSVATTHSFRYVIVPGGVASTSTLPSSGMLANRIAGGTVGGTGYTREELQAMSYEEVRRLFGIPED